jgi:adenylyltransferase/sulfurtransferase
MSPQKEPLIQVIKQEGKYVSAQRLDSDQVIVVPDQIHNRYASLELISWWKQDRIRKASVMVIGAGALGNEVLKNLALLGVGRILIVDFDVVEPGNLSRGILFRAQDSGHSKAEVAAAAIRDINPDVQVQAFHGDVNTDLGLGVFRRMDVIIGCLDNREARLALNSFAYRLKKPWVDGAIQELLGVARVFWPGNGACYECTLTAADWETINLRYSCSLINREKSLEGKVPTTPTIASIIAAIQTQEALKILHDIPVQPGTGFVYNGLNNFSYVVEYPIREDCLGHEVAYETIEALQEASAANTKLSELLILVRNRMGEDAQIELDFELVTDFQCPTCNTIESVFQPLRKLDGKAAQCPTCGQQRRPVTTHAIRGTETFLERTLKSIGVPALHILTARNGNRRLHFELSGDQATFFTWF